MKGLGVLGLLRSCPGGTTRRWQSPPPPVHVNMVNMGAFLVFAIFVHVVWWRLLVFTAIPNSTYCGTVLSITFPVVVVYLCSWYHMKGNTGGYLVVINMCYFDLPKNKNVSVFSRDADICKYNKNKLGKNLLFYFWWGVTLKGNHCHWYFLVPGLSRYENPNVDQVNTRGLF